MAETSFSLPRRVFMCSDATGNEHESFITAVEEELARYGVPTERRGAEFPRQYATMEAAEGDDSEVLCLAPASIPSVARLAEVVSRAPLMKPRRFRGVVLPYTQTQQFADPILRRAFAQLTIAGFISHIQS